MNDTTTPSTTKDQPVTAHFRHQHYRLSARYHSELARYSTWLFGSIVIAITFLLLAGLRNPHVLLLVCMYVAIGAFGVTVLLYPLINLFQGKMMALTTEQGSQPTGKAGKEAALALAAKAQRQQRQLTFVTRAQQAFFLLGLIAVIGFAIEVSLYLYATPQPAADASGAPAGT